MAEPRLALYQFDSCPFCRRVRNAADQLGIELELRDVLSDAERLRELVEATGRRTVPVLRVEGQPGEDRWLPESSDIIEFLESL